MSINQAGIDLIKSFESLRLKAYKDSGGVWTIGWGHTAGHGELTPKAGMTITAKVAESLLAADIAEAEAIVKRHIRVPMNANQYAALVSFAFNIGEGRLATADKKAIPGFQTSSVARLFNKGDVDGAARAFRLWNKDNGKVLPGLIRRREAERALFLRPIDATMPIPPPDVEPIDKVAPAPVSVPWGGIAAVIAAAAALFYSWWSWILDMFN